VNAVLKIIPMQERLQPILEAAPEVKPVQSDPGELNGEIEISHGILPLQPAGR